MNYLIHRPGDGPFLACGFDDCCSDALAHACDCHPSATFRLKARDDNVWAVVSIDTGNTFCIIKPKPRHDPAKRITTSTRNHGSLIQ